MFGIKEYSNDGGLTFPCKRDQWIMIKFTAAGFGNDKLENLNEVRIHLQVMFLSSVLGVLGKSLGEKYVHKKKIWMRTSQILHF